MRIGLFVAETGPGGSDIDAVVDRVVWAEQQGLATGWVPHIPWSLDALTVLALAGRATHRIELGTAVVPTWSHHPYGLAQHALTTQAACGGRLALGIGPSHRSVAEGWYGASYEGVIHHVREYVEVLEAANAAQAEVLSGAAGPLGGRVHHDGDLYPVESLLDVPGATEVPIFLAALAPLMLRLAGERTAGTITWMCDERAHATHVLPRLAAAAEAAGRPTPRVVAGLPVTVCSDRDEGLSVAARRYATYREIPTYARVLALGETGAPEQVAIVGTEEQVADRIRSYANAGVTDLAAMTFGVGDTPEERTAGHDRTLALLAELARG